MRNVFVSYSHRLDQDEADDFRVTFGIDRNVFFDRSLENQDIGNLNCSTIRDNYIRPKIRNSSVTIVLIGQETGGRWWCDWEIFYSLMNTVNNGRNGILGIYLPNKRHWIPQRIQDNMHMSKIINMPQDRTSLENSIEDVYALRFQNPNLAAPLRQRNSYIYQ